MKKGKGFLQEVEPVVFFAALSLIAIFIAFATVFNRVARGAFDRLQQGIVSNFGWFYILGMAFFLIFVVGLLLSPYGHVRLGRDDEQPEFSSFSWFAMLFSAGMGIGLVFWSIAEPISHFGEPPLPADEPWQLARQAMRYTFFHWGLHPWAAYVIVAMSMAYFSFRHKLPLTIRSVFYPILGKRIFGPIGHMIDTFSVVATLFGLTTSLGLGVMQINTGLNFLTGMPVTKTNQVLLITGITSVAVISVVTGLGKGVKLLSEFNIYLALALLIFIGVAGPTRFLLDLTVQTTGDYLQHVVELSFKTDAFRDKEWIRTWTIFYWAWWIAWAPFVGTFIARISRGRTIREFILGVLLVPTLVTFVWLAFFGGTALHMELFQGGGIAEAVKEDVTTALYVTLGRLPLPLISKALSTLLIATFFVTSSDSGTYVIDTFISGGNPDPPLSQRLIWGFMEGGVAALLVVVGGLRALQTASLTAALPFTVIMLFMCYCLVRALQTDVSGRQVVAREDQLKGD